MIPTHSKDNDSISIPTKPTLNKKRGGGEKCSRVAAIILDFRNMPPFLSPYQRRNGTGMGEVGRGPRKPINVNGSPWNGRNGWGG